jgi:hypothetical protein
MNLRAAKNWLLRALFPPTEISRRHRWYSLRIAWRCLWLVGSRPPRNPQ